MPVSSVLVTISLDVSSSAGVIEFLQSDLRFTLGESHGQLLPVVIETDSIRQSRDAAESIGALNGVSQVELVSLDFSDLDDPDLRKPDP